MRNAAFQKAKKKKQKKLSVKNKARAGEVFWYS